MDWASWHPGKGGFSGTYHFASSPQTGNSVSPDMYVCRVLTGGVPLVVSVERALYRA